MKRLGLVRMLVAILVLGTLSAYAQDKVKTTSSFTIGGEVKVALTVNLADFKKWKEQAIGDIVITNHLGEKKSEAKGLKGVLLRDVLSGVEINSESPKVLSEYYFVCKATDGYTVVYSWNEIFNTAVGDSAFIVTEKNGKRIDAMDDSILMVSSKDFKTGRRHVKSLTSIEVKHAK
jgi:hypothetical protein